LTTSFCTVAEADIYFNDRLFSDAWFSSISADKQKALNMATRKINNVPFVGVKEDTLQENAFPRCYRYSAFLNQYEATFNGLNWYCDITVPQAIKDACCEEALALIETGTSERGKLQRDGVQSFSVGGLSETYKKGANKERLKSLEAMQMLQPWLVFGTSYK